LLSAETGRLTEPGAFTETSDPPPAWPPPPWLLPAWLPPPEAGLPPDALPFPDP
jgi:hypothetical protein